MARRPDGSLELDVLRVLWRGSEPQTPAQVRDALGTELAYTTVNTILVRLHDKGLTARELRGRAYAYRPAVSESELTARRMGDALAAAKDHSAALSGFVGSLSRRDLAALRRAMNESGDE